MIKILIKETLERIIKVPTDCIDDAIDTVQSDYNNEYIVLNENDLTDSTIESYEDDTIQTKAPLIIVNKTVMPIISTIKSKTLMQFEDDFMLKYGYEYNDFINDDNRILFDNLHNSKEFVNVLNKYFVPLLHKKVLNDLLFYDNKREQFKGILNSIDSYLGTKDTLDFLEFNDYLQCQLDNN